MDFLDKKQLEIYYKNICSKNFAGKFLLKGSKNVKNTMENLLTDETLYTKIDEQIVLNQLDRNESALWSFLLANGYLKVAKYTMDAETGREEYALRHTNKEVQFMIQKIIYRWRLIIAICLWRDICAEHSRLATYTFLCECASPGELYIWRFLTTKYIEDWFGNQLFRYQGFMEVQMRDIIKEFYRSITEENVDLYEEIYYGARDGKIELLSEDIYPLCQLSIYDSEKMQPSDITETIRMVFWAIERGDMEEGFKELVKGLEYIYYKINADLRVDQMFYASDSYIYEYMAKAVFRYKKDELVLLGKVISENLSSIVIKKEIVRMIKRSLSINEDEVEEEEIENANILIENINRKY